MPAIADLMVNTHLTNFAVQYHNDKFIADKVSPVVIVPKPTGTYSEFDPEDAYKHHESLRGPDAEAQHVDWGVTDKGFLCQDYALRHFVSDKKVRAATAPIQPKKVATKMLLHDLNIGREIRVRDMVANENNYDNVMTLDDTAGKEYLDNAASKPFDLFESARELSLEDPNILVCNRQGFWTLAHHADIIGTVSGGATTQQPAKVLREKLAELLEFDEVIVGELKVKARSRKSGMATVRLWGNYMALLYVETSLSLDALSWSYTMRWKGGAGSKDGWKVREYPGYSRGGGVWIEPETCETQHVCCTGVGVLIKNPINPANALP